jgi:coenzyme F420-reducing hydrogenase delta subunit
MTEAYSTKEMLTEIRLDQREHNERAIRMEETLEAILEQAKKTNGRVTALEISNNDLIKEHDRFKTVVKTVSTLGAAAWAFITFIYK